MEQETLKVAVNARLLGLGGGVESFLIGLTKSLGELDDGSEQYVLIADWSAPDFLRPYIGPNQKIVVQQRPPASRTATLKRALRPLRPILRPIWKRLISRNDNDFNSWPQVEISSGFYESLGCGVIHFPYQRFVLCALPTIYNPHDLQHRHFPAFFSPKEIALRETVYSAGCRLSHTVAVASDWIKQDVIKQYSVDPRKIQVIPLAPPTQAYRAPGQDTLKDIRARHRLEEPFAFYPAMLWEHKNHLRLLHALALLRDRDKHTLRLVCTAGRGGPLWNKIEQAIRTLRLEHQVEFLDLLPPDSLRAVYRLAQFVIVPTLFEAASGPVFEAWNEDVPVACSAVTSLPEQVGDAALLFDPTSITSIADALNSMSSDSELRESLRKRGRRRLREFSWERTARAYRALYRRAARRELTEEDHWLLDTDWMKGPKESRVTA